MRNLSGFWIGRYAYTNQWDEAVRFDAEMTHEGDVVTGVITEPNTFDARAGELLCASVRGSVDTDGITFVKTYTGEGDAHHSITYHGRIDRKEDYIGGHWTIGEMQGLFEMKRDGPAIGVKAKVTEAAVALEKENVR